MLRQSTRPVVSSVRRVTAGVVRGNETLGFTRSALASFHVTCGTFEASKAQGNRIFHPKTHLTQPYGKSGHREGSDRVKSFGGKKFSNESKGPNGFKRFGEKKGSGGNGNGDFKPKPKPIRSMERSEEINIATLSKEARDEIRRMSDPLQWSHDAILRQWAPYFRGTLIAAMTEVKNNVDLLASSKAQLIDSQSHEEYLRQMQRRLVRDPLAYFGTTDKLAEFVDDFFDALPQISKEVESGKLVDTSPKAKNWEPRPSGKRPTPMEPDYVLYAQELSKRSKLVERLTERVSSRIATDLASTISMNKLLRNVSDLRLPHEWFPRARLMKRKIFFHGGPTNSGKTYMALKRLEEADPAYGGGLYCGPLRLLAMEVYEKMNRAGVLCDLVTGQEKRLVPTSTHVSQTIEMVSLDREYDVAVVDEIQMIGDPNRGHSWTRVLLGIPAREIHVCGGLEAEAIVKQLVELTGDDLEMVYYERMSKLEVEQESLRGNYKHVERGDCIVAFSVTELFDIKRRVESQTKHKCAMIYGSLPSETRSEQARLFNDPNSEHTVLIASDAIGMGLNLNIRRVIVHNTVKHRGPTSVGYLEPSNMKQIAGRAGRRNSEWNIGRATTWQEVDLAYLRAVMEHDVPQIKSAGLFPMIEHVERFAKQLTGDDFDEKTIELGPLLRRFMELSATDNRFFICNFDQILLNANWLQPIPMSLADRFTFANAPSNVRNDLCMHFLYLCASHFAMGVPMKIGLVIPDSPPTAVLAFQDLCSKHQMLELYEWLAVRFPMVFVDEALCTSLKTHALEMINFVVEQENMRAHSNFVESYIKTRSKLSSMFPSSEEVGADVAEKTANYLKTVDPELRLKLTSADSKMLSEQKYLSKSLNQYMSIFDREKHLFEMNGEVVATQLSL